MILKYNDWIDPDTKQSKLEFRIEFLNDQRFVGLVFKIRGISIIDISYAYDDEYVNEWDITLKLFGFGYIINWDINKRR